MNNEQQELLDEAYQNYLKYPLATRHDYRTNILYRNIGKGWCMLNGRSMVSPHPTRHLTLEEFINKCKNDSEFSEKWGLKIEERELTWDESNEYYNNHQSLKVPYLGLKVPTKLITITYNDKTIESYE